MHAKKTDTSLFVGTIGSFPSFSVFSLLSPQAWGRSSQHMAFLVLQAAWCTPFACTFYTPRTLHTAQHPKCSTFCTEGTLHGAHCDLVITPYKQQVLGNALHIVQTVVCWQLVEPECWPFFTSLLFHNRFLLRFLCVEDVAHFNCHPFSPIFSHFSPFSPGFTARSLL